MNPLQTGIAVALALAVVSIFFIFPNAMPFGGIAQNEINLPIATTTPMSQEEVTQLQVTDSVVGTGAAAAPGDTVTVNYVGSLTNGTVFDASANHGTSGFTFTLGAGQVIQGWDQGIVGMREGGKRKLVIPPSMAYGDRAIGNIIPSNSTLIFEVELVKVEKSAH